MITDAIKLKQYREHTKSLHTGEKLIFIGNNVCDVFVGEGWNTPTRYRKLRGQWVHQNGPRLDGFAIPG